MEKQLLQSGDSVQGELAVHDASSDPAMWLLSCTCAEQHV